MLRQVVLAGQPELVPLVHFDRLVTRRVAADSIPLCAVNVDGAVCAVHGTRAADEFVVYQEAEVDRSVMAGNS
jgi:hypothetical protein